MIEKESRVWHIPSIQKFFSPYKACLNDSRHDSHKVMMVDDRSMANVYWFLDEMNIVYLDNLYVNPDYRRKGIATHLQEIREEFGRKYLHATHSRLWTKNKSWMTDWYSRRGYEYYDDYEEESAIWMQKVL